MPHWGKATRVYEINISGFFVLAGYLSTDRFINSWLCCWQDEATKMVSCGASAAGEVTPGTT